MTGKCPRCGGRQRVDSSRRAGDVQVQYVECQSCRGRAKRLVPADQVWRRKR